MGHTRNDIHNDIVQYIVRYRSISRWWHHTRDIFNISTDLTKWLDVFRRQFVMATIKCLKPLVFQSIIANPQHTHRIVLTTTGDITVVVCIAKCQTIKSTNVPRLYAVLNTISTCVEATWGIVFARLWNIYSNLLSWKLHWSFLRTSLPELEIAWNNI